MGFEHEELRGVSIDVGRQKVCLLSILIRIEFLALRWYFFGVGCLLLFEAEGWGCVARDLEVFSLEKRHVANDYLASPFRSLNCKFDSLALC